MALSAAEKKAEDERAGIGRCEVVVEAAEAKVAKLEALTKEVAVAEEDAADWVLLAHDLGRDGLQACEIDAAVPEVNEIANDLLHSCHGSRFTCEIRTTRLSSDGKKMLDELDINVIDTVKGQDRLAEEYSGGECVIVGEAIALALTEIGCRDQDGPTLIRDESGASLDPFNGRAYIAMLRKAAASIGADKVLYVSHDPELQALADARIVIEDGCLRVVA